MNKQHKTQIVQALEAYLKQHDMSANQFAKKVGINESYISNMRNGSFNISVGAGKKTAIADKYFKMVAEFIGMVEDAYWKTVPTDQMKRMVATLEDAKEFGYTNVIIGETGCGKTYIANLFAKAHPMDLFVITVGSNDRIGDLMDKVLDKINVPQAKTKSKKIRDIVKYFKNKQLEGQKPMLIFDEAEYMKQPTLCTIKEFYDNLLGICSIILIGTDQLLDNLEKLKRRNKPGIPQLYRRIKFGVRTLPSIDRTYKQFLTKITDKDLKRFLVSHCDNYGEVHDVLVTAMREADRTGQELTEQFVRVLFNIPKAA